MNRRIPLAPAEGWLTVGLVGLLCLSLAWSLDDAQLVLGIADYTDFLTWAAIGGVAIGFIGPKVGWGRWTTILIGTILGALLVPLLVGVVLDPEDGSPGIWFTATATSVVNAFTDLVWENRLSTSEFGHHLWVLGLIVWASSLFASHACFGHRRPINAVLLIGLLLVANMSLTVRDQLPYLVLFSLAALFLLIRFHTFDEQADWLRRRIGDPAAISSLYLRGGTVFIGVAVVGSLLLTRFAASDPLAGVWTDVSVRVVEWSRAIEKFLPEGGSGVAFAPTFGSTATIGTSWFTSNDPALEIEVPATETEIPYWRAVTFDTLLFDGYGRSQDTNPLERETGEAVLDATGDEVTSDGRREVTYRITPSGGGTTLIAPSAPEALDVPIELTVLGEEAWFVALDRRGSSGAYTVTSLIRDTDETVPGALTANRLRVAGTEFPEAILERYAETPGDDLVGPQTLVVLDEILAITGPDPTQYDLAKTIESYLRDSANFTYDPNLIDDGIDCDGLSRIECFATFKRGFCQYYAALMTALLREQGYPARIAEGYLPGSRELGTGRVIVRNSDAHAWVEVYFPRYGWVDFDPTGGGVAQIVPLPSGQVEASPSSDPSASGPTLTRPPEDAEPSDNEPAFTGTGPINSSPVGPFIAVTMLLAVIVGVVAFTAWRRGPRGPVSADGAYGSITRLATRLGFAPRPNQTVYEYAGALAEVLPGARPELETVARAKVEVAYGGRTLGEDRLASLKDAQRRLRVSLLRLLFRRDRRKHR
ncbi:MAG TPA: transglutaminase domain-containing protein [Candidatus Saccharimonadales bacterium]|nr:transglutaminase domain-containing protein [Candidatus Saccharimonadales bacterium]